MSTHCALCRHSTHVVLCRHIVHYVATIHIVPCVDTFYLFHRHMLIHVSTYMSAHCVDICRLPFLTVDEDEDEDELHIE